MGDKAGSGDGLFVEGIGDTVGVEEEFHIVNRSNGLVRPGASTLMSPPADVEPELQSTCLTTSARH